MGENFGPDTQTFGENAWKLNANCDNSATMYKDIKGPCEIVFKWKKSISYGSAFEFSMYVKNIKKKLICPSFDEWNDGSFYIPDDGVHRITWEYKKKASVGQYCNMDSSAWLKNIVISNKSPIEIEPIANMSSSRTNMSQTNFTSSNPVITTSLLNLLNSNIHININISNINDKIPTDENLIYNKSRKSQLVIKSIWPKENDVLPLNVPIKFEFIPFFSNKIPICKLYIDNVEKNKSRSINNNSNNELGYKFNDSGMHGWQIECSDC